MTLFLEQGKDFNCKNKGINHKEEEEYCASLKNLKISISEHQTKLIQRTSWKKFATNIQQTRAEYPQGVISPHKSIEEPLTHKQRNGIGLEKAATFQGTEKREKEKAPVISKG